MQKLKMQKHKIWISICVLFSAIILFTPFLNAQQLIRVGVYNFEPLVFLE